MRAGIFYVSEDDYGQNLGFSSMTESISEIDHCFSPFPPLSIMGTTKPLNICPTGSLWKFDFDQQNVIATWLVRCVESWYGWWLDVDDSEYEVDITQWTYQHCPYPCIDVFSPFFFIISLSSISTSILALPFTCIPFLFISQHFFYWFFFFLSLFQSQATAGFVSNLDLLDSYILSDREKIHY